ncbi:MAG: TlpA disulfide reductase family protein [Bacteroidales bacterium]|nr:TlpA disulfide reductase family protein [Bacteroidales bacterium]MDT8432435.1 TlpA disulfide reductase family protein [Bacteroidales bacterium]
MKMKHFSIALISLTIIFLASCGNKPSGTTAEETAYTMPPEIEALRVGTTLGLRAPEIEMPNLEGETMQLSSLRGKLVLIDFWASWCNPCRLENPHLVKVYDEFNDASFTKGEGFEIFSVSLDRNEEAWRKAVMQDRLDWPYQLGTMEGARTQAAQDYGIQMIPSNFLLDQHGVIIATNLRGDALNEKLNSLIAAE